MSSQMCKSANVFHFPLQAAVPRDTTGVLLIQGMQIISDHILRLRKQEKENEHVVKLTH